MDVSQLEKSELHCHADGVVTPNMLEELAARGHELGVTPDTLRGALPVRSWEDWGRRYASVVQPALQPYADRLPILVSLHIESLRAQNVRYAEIMVPGLVFCDPDLGVVKQAFRNLSAAVAAATGGSSLQVGLLAAIGRGPVDRAERQVDRIIKLYADGLICGMALAGDERACTVRSLAHLFRRLHDSGMGIEIHAGETLGPPSVLDALDHGRPHRLGHALSAFRDDSLVERIVRAGVHVEFCPTSNVKVGQVRTLAEHPIKAAKAAGIRFSINTDDPGPFECTISSEYQLAADTFGFSDADFARVHADTMAAAFRGR